MKHSLYDIPALTKYLSRKGFGDRDLRRSNRLLFREFKSLEETGWERPLLDELESNFETSYLTLISRVDSNIDGASKLLFETRDGKKIETVILRIATGRTSICVSSQVGCTEKCRFCATGELGFFRNLKREEILDQVVQAGRILASEGRSLRNIVFMGMGEPLRNYDNLMGALELLTTQNVFDFAPKRITVSSLGIPELILKFAKRFPQVGFALSLNGSNDQGRSAVMPINDRYPMAQLRAMLEELETIRGTGAMIEYIMFKDLNDSLEAADEVAAFLQGLDAHVNLIPYNPDYSLNKSFLPSDTQTIEAFKQRLQDAGYKVTRRFSLGQDIAAACGQLANKG
ncbi:23S rRNA (adenine(2503)-C(2))-methyltransferase RlmN [Pelagicoccus sp. SDUM812005]|uniref:23S rRNA (adenine(2503)-C(2))-methyltransferase RlmN n=1 Tax=Pelagicoccus sp. SDUM812005 TaxID=3041257 RepID=UPI00280DB161|nr:23S rRNA (adenine(2503)-C(2))-methyltransferase RlmN [Pelagicoccus sp. SDUM812005]MDQ8181479.1 23S rRNA (adenine(2503)-C(2))-methyltransferase RlmN [Pelagicoccus sp. SDUM812005]